MLAETLSETHFSVSGQKQTSFVSSVDLEPGWYWIIINTNANVTFLGDNNGHYNSHIPRALDLNNGTWAMARSSSATPAGWGSLALPASGASTPFTGYTTDLISIALITA